MTNNQRSKATHPDDKLSRRQAVIGGVAILAGGAIFGSQSRADGPVGAGTGGGPDAALPAKDAQQPAPMGQGYTPVITPNGATLEWRIVDGWKVGHLVVEEFDHEFAPGLRAKCWGYNGRTPGPTIEAVEGDRIRIYVTNHLYAPTTIHWHGIFLPNGMDGVTGLNQAPIPPGRPSSTNSLYASTARTCTTRILMR